MRGKTMERVFVWQLPVRFFHWINALCIVALGVMMLPKNGEAYKFTKDAAKTIKQEAENVMDSMSGMH